MALIHVSLTSMFNILLIFKEERVLIYAICLAQLALEATSVGFFYFVLACACRQLA